MIFACLSMALFAAAPNPFLAEARVQFQAQEYARCLKRLEQSSSWRSTTAEEAEIALYRGLCQLGVGDDAAAAGSLERALVIDPRVALPTWVSPRLAEAFEAARRRVGVAPDAPARPEPSLATAPTRSVGVIPAIVAAGVSAVALGIAIGLGVHARALEGRSFSERFEVDARSAALGARDFATAANGVYAGSAVALVGAGVLFFIDWLTSR